MWVRRRISGRNANHVKAKVTARNTTTSSGAFLSLAPCRSVIGSFILSSSFFPVQDSDLNTQTALHPKRRHHHRQVTAAHTITRRAALLTRYGCQCGAWQDSFRGLAAAGKWPIH
jgi:hypothetical protein